MTWVRTKTYANWTLMFNWTGLQLNQTHDVTTHTTEVERKKQQYDRRTRKSLLFICKELFRFNLALAMNTKSNKSITERFAMIFDFYSEYTHNKNRFYLSISLIPILSYGAHVPHITHHMCTTTFIIFILNRPYTHWNSLWNFLRRKGLRFSPASGVPKLCWCVW